MKHIFFFHLSFGLITTLVASVIFWFSFPFSIVQSVTESTNYRVHNPSIINFGGTGNSGSFQVNVSGYPVGGQGSSNSFNTQSGAPVGVTAVSGSSSSGASGGGGSVVNTGIGATVESFDVLFLGTKSVHFLVSFSELSLVSIEVQRGGQTFLLTPETRDFFDIHEALITQLTPGTVYSFFVITRDREGNVVKNGPYFATTLPDISILPPVVLFSPQPTPQLTEEPKSDRPSVSSGSPKEETRSPEESESSPELELIRATPPPLPETVVPAKEHIDKEQIQIFSLLRQRVKGVFDRTIEELLTTIRDVSAEKKAQIKRIHSGIIDEFGQLSVEIYNRLSARKKREVARVLELPLPPEFSPPTELFLTPFTSLSDSQRTGRLLVSNSDALISLPEKIFQKPVETIIATIEARAYVLLYVAERQAYETVIRTPEKKGNYEMIIQIIYADNTYDEIYDTVLVDPYGVVVTKQWVKGRRITVPLGDVEVTLWTKTRTGEWVVWPATLYSQHNPQLTDEEGRYAFVVPKGEYQLRAKKEGYHDYMGAPFSVEEELVNIPITLSKRISSTSYGVSAGVLAFASLLAFVTMRRRVRL